MKRFTAQVTETRVVVCQYVVEADDSLEAFGKMKAGETVEEVDLRNDGIINREVMEGTMRREKANA